LKVSSLPKMHSMFDRCGDRRDIDGKIGSGIDIPNLVIYVESLKSCWHTANAISGSNSARFCFLVQRCCGGQ
jgi:hypothetical protein